MRATLWAGRILTAIAALFLLFDAGLHMFQPAPVIDAMTRLQFPMGLTLWIGVLELLCVILYVIPRTAVLGAVLLTGYLGGATAIQVRAGSPTFEEIFPVIMGVLVWLGLLLRDKGLRKLIPVRR